jgi:RNA polymerase sigma-70 factor (ECF subfamily)
MQTPGSDEEASSQSFEEVALPHLDAAYNLARWLLKNDQDAQDAVQEAYLRALKFFGSFKGGNARAWLLTIVRNTCYTFLKKNRPEAAGTEFDENLHGIVEESANQEEKFTQKTDVSSVRRALEELPVEYREVIILREMEGLSYKEIAQSANVPLGTVMSRLARARKWLQQRLLAKKKED